MRRLAIQNWLKCTGASDFYRSASQSDLYFILATGLKLRSIFTTVTFRQLQLKIYFELQYFIPLLKSDK